MKNGMLYRSNEEESVDALCDNCEQSSHHDYSPWESILESDDEYCCMCNAQIYTIDAYL